MYTRMDPRDRDDQAEAAVLAGTGEDASAEECVPPAVVSVGDRGCEGAPEEQASASLALSGEREREGAAAEVADASPVVSGDGRVLAENVVERRGNQGDEEDDGIQADDDPDDLVSALMRSMRRRLFPPEDGKNPM
ncbi:hypothetical protein E2562_002330 [Oryza meyeriana var. granulata]|uniref:Uncharacterized protein n=1 Tax=Oryza meyeriana var. granulata TaxID=110450 RepID=A0A6G1BJM0_9ORYZ|nr:hypothetical protein E2562_002330 [Oryza meyeriana var. granulata]